MKKNLISCWPAPLLHPAPDRMRGRQRQRREFSRSSRPLHRPCNRNGGRNSSVHETETVDLSSVPEYSGEPYIVINDNIPDFSEGYDHRFL